MPSSPTSANPKPPSRKFQWLAAVVIAGSVLWSIGWLLFASRVEAGLPDTLARIVGPGATADCVEPAVRGYPFRFGLFCDAVTYSNPAQGINAGAGAFRSAAQFYRPSHIVGEIDGPMTLTAPGLAVRGDWRVAQASARVGLARLNRGSFDSRDISIDIDGAGLPRKLALEAGRVTGHVRGNDQDLDVASYAENFRSSLLPGVAAESFALEATLPGQAKLLEVPYVPITEALDIQLHRLAIAFDGAASLELAGPLRREADGRLSGNLELTLRNQERLAELAATVDPNLASLLSRMAPMITALDTRPGDDGVTVPVTLRANRVSIGLFPLGELPAF